MSVPACCNAWSVAAPVCAAKVPKPWPMFCNPAKAAPIPKPFLPVKPW